MSYEATHNAIRTKFATDWGVTTTVAYENAEFRPPAADTAWARLTVVDAMSEQVSMGGNTNFYRHSGLIIVGIFTPLNAGDKLALSYVDSVSAIFRSWRDPTNKITVYSPEVVRVGPSDKWYQVNVQFYFERDSLI